MGQIVVLIHKNDTFDDPHYFLWEMSKIWRETGHSVTVLNGPGKHVDADLAILHVDLTQIPDSYLDFASHYPAAINGGVKDISKQAISNHLVTRGDGYEGRVIVKTNYNCKGAREAFQLRHASSLTRLFHGLRNRTFPWTLRPTLDSYAVFDSPSAVPRTVWFNRHLVVEQFRPELRDGYYCLRTWLFFGEKERNSISYSNEPIVKSENIVKRELISEVPEALRQQRAKLGFDFGKFDYAISDSEVVLYDANLTPTFGGMAATLLPGIRQLAEGIESFL